MLFLTYDTAVISILHYCGKKKKKGYPFKNNMAQLNRKNEHSLNPIFF